MLILQRLLLFAAPVAWIAGLEIMKEYPSWWWAAALFVAASVFFAVWYACRRELNKVFFNFLILPLAFVFSAFVLALFVVNGVFFQALVLTAAFLLYVLLRQYYFYFNLPFRFQPYSLEGLSWLVGIVGAYFLFAGCFGGLMLLQLNIWIVLPALIVPAAFSAYHFFWINKISFEKSRLAVLVVVLALAELFYAVSCLPTSYFVNAFILTASYYLMLGTGRLYFMNALTRKKLAAYFLVAGIAFVAVLLTAQWT